MVSGLFFSGTGEEVETINGMKMKLRRRRRDLKQESEF
jgi:hypothetical protein